jgi:hypothetical protein
MTNGSGGISIKGPNAGAVYALNLKGGQSDTSGTAINSEWVPVDMAAVPAWSAKTWPRRCAGQPGQSGQDRQPGQHQVLGKTAHPVHRRRQRHARQQLPVGLQRRHQGADAHAVDAGGAESTGLHAVDDINGWTYIMSNFQHPATGRRACTTRSRPRWIR